MKELARLRQHEAQLQQELVGTRVSTQREIEYVGQTPGQPDMVAV